VGFTFTTSLTVYKVHAAYKLFFQVMQQHNQVVINPTHLYQRWLHTYELLFNLFYYKTLTYTFGPQYLQDEIYALNWSMPHPTQRVFKHSAPQYLFQDSVYGHESLKVFNQFKRLEVGAAMLLDLTLHKKTLYYLRQMGVYTIGLTPSYIDP